jgi:hypothetical protein
MDRGRKRKMEEKEKAGGKILMPEVFVSNYMKQQRNFVKYRREKSKLSRSAPKVQAGAVEVAKPLNLAPFEQIKPNVLVLAIRIKE